MYARKLVDEKIEKAEKELGYRLERHCPSEIDTFNQAMEARFPGIYEAARHASTSSKEPEQVYQTYLYKNLCSPDSPRISREELRFIENERALIMCDAAYWMTRYYWIKNRANNLQRFTFQRAQAILLEIIGELELLGISIELMIPKARQLGVTTEITGLGLHKVAYSFGVSGIVSSAAQDKTEDMVDKMFMAYDLIPWWARPMYNKRVNSAKGAFAFRNLRAGLRFQHGSQNAGIGRGSTPIYYMLSEVASYSNPSALIESSLWKAVHASPRVLGIMESTCEGNTGWWHDTYMDSKANWPRARMKSVFLPFTIADDMYPSEIDLRKNPIPALWYKDRETVQMMRESEEYVKADPVLHRILGSTWRVPERVAWYWQCEFQSARLKGQEKKWYQEMPHTDKAAFQGSYESVFSNEVITEVNRQREKSYQVFSIVGQSVEERYEPLPEEFDNEENIVEVKYLNRLKAMAYKWELQPLLWREPFKAIEDIRGDGTDHMNKLFVYLEPEKGYDYSIGIRTGNGIGHGQTAIAVARRGRHSQEPDVQAAEFRSDEVSHVEAYAWSMAIAAYFAKYMGRDEFDNQSIKREPYVAIEQMAAAGDTCQFQMRQMGYRRFHRMVRYDQATVNKAGAGRIGWFSSAWSTPMFADSFVVWIRNGWYKVNSPYTTWEMDHWEARETQSGKAKYIHGDDASDSGLLANAMAAFCVNDMKPMAERTLKRYVEGSQAKPQLDLTPTGLGISFPMVAPYGKVSERLIRGNRYSQWTSLGE